MSIQSVRLYYVYSFAFSRVPLREQVSIGEESIFLGSFIRDKLVELSQTHYLPNVAWHKSEEEEPPESRAALYVPFHHLSIDTQENRVNLGFLGAGHISSHIALFESGMGVIWIMVEPANAPTLDNLSLAVGRESFPKVSLTDLHSGFTAQEKSIHDIFREEIKQLNKLINDAISSLGENVNTQLLRRFPNIFRNGDNNNVFAIEWLDTDKPLFWHDNIPTGDHLNAFQEPSIAIVVQAAEEFRDLVDNGKDGRPRVERFISVLLHSTTDSNLDLTHACAHVGDNLCNLHPDKRFRTFLHANCLLVVHAEPLPSDPLKRFLKGLFRTFCALRGCWHIYNVINEQLDQVISRLISEFTEMSNSSNNVQIDLLKKQEDIIRMKGYFLSSLATQDPLVWGIGLTPFGKIYKIGSEIFNTKELLRSVQYKLRELDRLFDIISSYKLRHSFSVTKRRGDSSIIYFIIAVILILTPVLFFVFTNPGHISFVYFIVTSIFVLAGSALIKRAMKSNN